MLLPLCSSAAIAQDVEPTTESAASQGEQADGYALGDIVVTAQKRAENVQKVPLAITAVSGAALANQSIVEVSELTRIDPTLQIGESTGALQAFIRGIGNPSGTSGNEASVPTYIDDVYYVRASPAYFDLASVDRVEVLKGPQGTLFGRNASGGALAIHTRNPTQKPEMVATLGYGNFQTMDARLYLNAPISSTLAANFALSFHDQDKGWGQIKTLVNQLDTSQGYLPGGQDYWYSNHLSMRGKVLWTPTDTTSVKLVGYYQRSDGNIGLYSRPFPGTVGGTPDAAHNNAPTTLVPGGAPTPSQILPTLGFYDVALISPYSNPTHGGGASIRIDQETGFADLVSITAFRESTESVYISAVNAPYSYLYYDLGYLDKQFSQEFQIKSRAGSAVNWILGAYYLQFHGGFDPAVLYGPGLAGAGIDNVTITGKQRVRSYAGYGQVTVPIGERTHITGGLRYTRDNFKVDGQQVINFLPVGGSAAQSIVSQKFDSRNDFGGDTGRTIIDGANPEATPRFEKVTWKANIDHEFTPDVMAYANYSRGYKSGTFNTLPLSNFILKPEVVDAYELGFKSQFADGRVRINAALFWNDISDPQVQTTRNNSVFLVNAGSARTKGVEVDATARLARGLTMRAAGSYLDAKYRRFDNAPSYCPNVQITPAQCQILSPTIPVAPGNLNPFVVNASGNYMPYASKWKFTGSLDYEGNLASGATFTANVTGNYSSPFNWDADNVIKEPSRFLLDAAASFTPAGSLDKVTFRVWVKNLTGEKYNINYSPVTSGSGYASSPGAPRTYGGEMTFKF